MNESKFNDYFSEGTSLLHKGDTENAVSLLEEAIRLEPEHTDTAINLSGAYILSGKFKKALALLQPLSEREPDNPMVWTNLGAAYLGNPVLARDKEQLQALAAFEKALSIQPAVPSVAYNIALIHRDREEYELAIKWFRQALRDNPNDRHARSMLEKMTS